MRILTAFCFALTLVGQTTPDAIAPSKKMVLFNGKNLDNFYTWLVDDKYQDPKHVFTVQDGSIKVSGEEWGGLTTKNAYRDYHLIVEWRWGGPNLGARAGHARDSGILVHGIGEDGAHQGIWLESIESQIIEGGAGDFIMVEGKGRPSMTANVREFEKQPYWDEKGVAKTLDKGRFNWYGRDPKWKDELGYRGPKDVEKPMGEWNRQEVIADGDTITNIVNGVVVNKGYRANPQAGKIQLQSEGAEIYYRRVELLPAR
ncbi:MAG TPA: DUF1080 domain-containing protein [Bryobacteraceae bacterium]|nr:DUF1080 domain-containing protein [Bryobacteraceae bacterium]